MAGRDGGLEAALFAEADCVAATGSDETLAAIRKALPAACAFVGLWDAGEFWICGQGGADRTPRGNRRGAAALDVAAWNQLGCLSPHVIYVEEGGEVGAEGFADLLAGQLEALEKTHPRGPLAAQEAAGIAARRSFYEVRAAHSPETKMWASAESTAWTVVLETEARFQISCLNRFVYVKAVHGCGRGVARGGGGAGENFDRGPGRAAGRGRRNWRGNSPAGARGGFARWGRCRSRRWAGGTTGGRRWAIC